MLQPAIIMQSTTFSDKIAYQGVKIMWLMTIIHTHLGLNKENICAICVKSFPVGSFGIIILHEYL